jgi:S1-C subfamily serine protease
MKTLPAVLSCCLLVVAAPAPVRADPSDAVVKVIASVRFPDPTRPWAKGQAMTSAGTGVIIEGQRILTNAHVVMYATELYVEARPGDDKVEATVQFLAPDVDLAVLTVKEARLFHKKPPLGRANKLPAVQDSVVVYGFPIGGNGLSVTRGEISRILFSRYGNHGYGVTLQVSAPINPGNSGGPAVVAGKMVGLVYSRLNGAQNIGGVIPNEEIETFLEDIKDGRYDGKPFEVMPTLYQPLENEALRRMLKVDASVKGVLAHPQRRPDASYPYQPFDIVTRIGDHDIDNTGMVQLENGLRAPFLYLIPRLARDHRVPVTLRRQGKQIRASLPVTQRDSALIPPYQGEPLSYFIHGPLVFAPARAEDTSLYAQMNRTVYADNSPLMTRNADTVRFPGEELVVVSAPMFAHRISKGYANPVGKVVKNVNGVEIKNLRHLVETLRDCTDAYLTFRFADQWSEVLVFNRHELEKATENILEDQGIAVTRRGSADMLKVWKAKAGAAR